MRLLKLFNQKKLPGDVNYYPLNVLKLESNNIKYPETQDAIPLITKVKYETKVDKAIHAVFDRVLLCRNAEIATQLAKQANMDCVLLDGDFISRKGALTGGYVDTRQSKLSYYGHKLELGEQVKVKEAELEKVQAEIRSVDQQLNNVLNELQKHETRNKRNKDTYEQMKSDLLSRKNEIERLEKLRPQKLRSIESLNADISRFETSKELYQAELGTELLKQLSGEDQKSVDELNDKIHGLNEELKEVLNRRVKVEADKLQLDTQLQNILSKRKEELLQQLSESRLHQRGTKVDLYKSELGMVSERVEVCEEKIRVASGEVERIGKGEIVKAQRELERLQDQERKLQEDLQESTVDLEKVSSKLSLLLKKKDECLKATRNLGVLPADAYDKYQDMGMKQLYLKMDSCNQELKKLSHVNKKAMDQFLQFSEHKEKLLLRREEGDRAYKSILEFINTLDRRKNENMQSTFKQVGDWLKSCFLYFDWF